MVRYRVGAAFWQHRERDIRKADPPDTHQQERQLCGAGIGQPKRFWRQHKYKANDLQYNAAYVAIGKPFGAYTVLHIQRSDLGQIRIVKYKTARIAYGSQAETDDAKFERMTGEKEECAAGQ